MTNRLVFPENTNERVLRELSPGTGYTGLLEIRKRSRGKRTELFCVAEGAIPLTKVLMSSVSKKVFLDTALQIGQIVQMCEEHLTPNNLDLKRDRIFVDPMTKRIRCVYWPVVNNQEGCPPSQFLRELSYGLTFTPYEDHSYLDTYADFFSGLQAFTGANYVKMILSLQGKEAPEERQMPGVGSVGAASDEAVSNVPIHPAVRKPNHPTVEYDAAAAAFLSSGREEEAEEAMVYCSYCRKRIRASAEFCRYCGNKQMIMAVEVSSKTAVLTRVRTGERVTVGKELFRIGTAEGYCDWVISGNSSISHIHADILSKDGKFFLTDRGSYNRGSTNGTYYQGIRLLPGVERELQDGTSFYLADEEFRLTMEQTG